MKAISTNFDLSAHLEAMVNTTIETEPEQTAANNAQIYWRELIYNSSMDERPAILKKLWWSIARHICKNFKVAQSELLITSYIVNQAIDRWLPIDIKIGDFNSMKGVYLYGDVGVGKTTLLKSITLFHAYCNNVLHLSDFRDINDYKEDTYAVNCLTEVMKHQFSERELDHRLLVSNLLIDDLGKEAKSVQRFGNKVNLFEYIIFERYNNFKKRQAQGFNYLITNITSNNTIKEIRNDYGAYTADRLIEMCELIEWKGESKR